MNTATTVERFMDRVAAGHWLTPDEVRELAGTTDILAIGMLADAVRRSRHGRAATFLRVADLSVEAIATAAVPDAAREIRLTGTAASLDRAIAVVEAARARAGGRTVSAFSWTDVERWSEGASPAATLARLKAAGLDALASLAIDEVPDLDAAVAIVRDAGFDRIRLTVTAAPAADRIELLIRVGAVQAARRCIHAISPLPSTLAAFRPTTGYEDVKMVAIARLAAPDVPSVQVDWRRYGPKLAQVALTFGADDIDGISASDDVSEGRRRAPLAEIRRNVQDAGFEAVERDGRFVHAG